MNESSPHPWQRGPAELLHFALKTSQLNIQVNQLVAFLLLDVCVETTMRTFLSLPDGLVQTKMKYFERRKFSEGNFHELTKGIEASAKIPIGMTDLHYAKYYHALRNQLYHQGSGVTVSTDDVMRYSSVASSLLKHLLGVDQEVRQEALKTTTSISKDAFLTLKTELPTNLNRFRDLINLLFETLEPKLIYPTTIKKLSDIAVNIEASSFPHKLRELRQLIETTIKDNEIRVWLLDLMSDDVEGDSEQVLRNSQFLMELGSDHISLYSLVVGMFFLPVGDVRKDSVDRYEDISFLDNDDYSIMGIYNACVWFEKYFLTKSSVPPDDIPVVGRGIEVNGKLVVTIKRLEALVQA